MKILAWPAFAAKIVNPYSWQLYKSLETAGVDVYEYNLKNLLLAKYEVFHVHWPDYQLAFKNPITCLVRIFYIFTVLIFAKIRGAKIVWTVHNLHSHEGFHPFLERIFWVIFLKLLDGYISLSESGHLLAQSAHPALKRKQGGIIPLGHYRDFYKNCVSRDNARKRLGISPDARVLLFLGVIRTYKNVPELIRAFRKTDHNDAVLVIAGKTTDRDLENEILESAEGDQRVRLHLDFVPPEELQLFLNSSDLMVLPYKDILNSASALLSLSFSIPVLVPDKGAMGELKLTLGQDWVETYRGEFGRDTLMNALAAISPRRNGPDLTAYGWDVIAAKTSQFYSKLVSSSYAVKLTI